MDGMLKRRLILTFYGNTHLVHIRMVHPKYSKSLESANEEIWRRILNNLPYILKHKGTGRAMKAVMACYGVPQSMLTIMEFGGPTRPIKRW